MQGDIDVAWVRDWSCSVGSDSCGRLTFDGTLWPGSKTARRLGVNATAWLAYSAAVDPHVRASDRTVT